MPRTESLPYPLGVTLRHDGASVAIYSETAEAIDVCVFVDGEETAVRLTERTGHVFHGMVPGLAIGSRYALRVHGEWAPERGLRHNPYKLLLDPHATAIEGEYTWGQAVFGHDMNAPDEMDTTDAAGSTPLCVVTNPDFEWHDDRSPRVPLDETVIYETHVKGFTQLHPDIPEEIRGTYAGLAHPAAIKHFTDLGITSVELIPVHQFAQDSHLLEQGLRNYWGYNTLGFFAPHGDYSSAGDGGEQVNEFKNMVKSLHAAGLEVILDVVYNHTAEGNHMGPSLSFKGIDNAAYYRLVEGDEANYFDTTGTGNSLNVGHPAALGLIMDSLRYWVTEMHVDGFRFDLATTLTRQGGDAELHSAFLTLIAQDPTLAPVKMIAEPWDTAGYQVGGFPADWSEWNGKFRDDLRDFWNESDGVLGTVAQRLLGSPDVYEASRRSPLSSVNFITAHDGFTLNDLVSYNEKHNEANGEGNRDGESDNKSNNQGVEGPTDDPIVLERRARMKRNFLASLFLSAGVPMLLGGDELGRTQQGSNNAYCQDNEISWYDWANVDTELLAFTTELIRLRCENPALHPTWYRQAPVSAEAQAEAEEAPAEVAAADEPALPEVIIPDADVEPDTVDIVRADAEEFADHDWDNPTARTITLVVESPESDAFALLLNSAHNGVEFVVPDAPYGEWELALSSDPEQTVVAPVTTLIVSESSFTLLRSRVQSTD